MGAALMECNLSKMCERNVKACVTHVDDIKSTFLFNLKNLFFFLSI